MRWWAASEPHVGPDEIDLAFLAPDGRDPRFDLGGVLFGAHRVGEAACLAAAENGAVDAGSLTTHLAAAREQLAPPLVEGISKCVSEGDSYAGLLARDLLDEADESAAWLFSTAISRGVAPSLAVARAGAVYGVPTSELGRYRALALDAKANPVAVRDAADKAIADFVEKVCAEETREAVSKDAETPEERRAAQADQPRLRGRYANRQVRQLQPQPEPARHLPALATRTEMPTPTAEELARRTGATVGQPGLLASMRTRLGIGAQAAPKVATGRPTEQETAAPTQSLAELHTRQQQLQRTRQRTTARRAPAPAKPAAAQQTETKITQLMRQQTRQESRMRQLSALAIPSVRSQTKAAARDITHPADYDAWTGEIHPALEPTGRPANRYYRPLDYTVGFVLPDEGVAYGLAGTLAETPNRMIRVGYLQENYADGRPATEVYDKASRYQDHVEDAAEVANSGMGPVETLFIPASRLPSDPVEQSRFLKDELDRFAAANGDRQDKMGIWERTELLPDANGEGMVLVTGDEYEDMPTIWEVTIERALAQVELDPSEMEIIATHMDPDQVISVNTEAQAIKVWDRHHHVKRIKHTGVVVPPDQVTAWRTGRVRKADTRSSAVAVRPDDPATEFWDARDASGRFATSGVLVPAPPKTEAKPVKAPSVADLNAKRAQLTRYYTQLQRPRTVLAPPAARAQAQTEAPTAQQTSQRGGQQSAQRAPSQRYRKRLKDSAADRKLADTLSDLLDAEYDVLDLAASHIDPDREYRVIRPDDLWDIRAENAQEGIGRWKLGIIPVRDEESLAYLDTSTRKGQAIRPAIKREAFLDQRGDQRIVGVYLTREIEDEVLLSRRAANMAATRHHGVILEQPTTKEVDGEHLPATALIVSGRPKPLVLIEFDPDADPNGPYDLVRKGTYWHPDLSEYADRSYVGDATARFGVFLEHYVATSPDHSDELRRKLRSGGKQKPGS